LSSLQRFCLLIFAIRKPTFTIRTLIFANRS
jgi:hypothetical protein